MAYYLIQGSYTPEAWAALVKTIQNSRIINSKLRQSRATAPLIEDH